MFVCCWANADLKIFCSEKIIYIQDVKLFSKIKMILKVVIFDQIGQACLFVQTAAIQFYALGQDVV